MGPGDMMDEDSMDGGDAMRRHMQRGDDRRGGRGGGDEMLGKHVDGGHRGGHHGDSRWDRDDNDQGAVFRFQQEGGPSFRIKCAARDTTLECASAIMPMLDRLMPTQPGSGQ